MTTSPVTSGGLGVGADVAVAVAVGRGVGVRVLLRLHALLVGLPGLGKTELVKALATLLGLMVALTAALTLIFAVMAFRAQNALERAGFALVVGGALGNIIDRVRQGAVTDFLDFYWRDWHWPTFNVADIAITLGAVLILAASFPLCRRKEPVLDQS